MKRLSSPLMLAALAAVLLALAVVSAGALAVPGAHTQKEVNESIEKGVAYLDTQQNATGSYGTSAPFSETGMTLVAYSVLANGSFENLSKTYQEHVTKAIEWLLKEQKAEGDWADGSGFLQTYATGIAIAGLEPFKGVNAGVPAAIKKGREFLEGEFKGAPNFVCSSEEKSPTGSWCGGWSYDKDISQRSDESNTGFALFGLHQTGGVPAGIAAQNKGWQHHVQDIKSNEFAKREDGGGGYIPECASLCTSFSSNANDTGSMLFGFGYDGVPLSDEGIKAGITFGEDILNLYELEKAVSRTMVYHTGTKEDGTCKIGAAGCDWFFGSGEGGYHYSLFSLTKGLGEYIAPQLKEASNWYAKVVDLLLTQQEANGSWPPDLRDDASIVFATALSVGSLGLVGTPEVKTSLSGEGKSGEKITVKEESPVTDSATLEGSNTKTATGEVTYKIYSDNECTKLVKEAGTVKVAAGVVPSSEPETLSAGTYYWQASYSGDENHGAASSKCANEVLTVERNEKKTCGKTTVGKTKDGLVANRKRVNNGCTLATKATATELTVYLAPTTHSGSQVLKGIVYADSKGKPGALEGTTTQLTFTSKSPAGWYHLTFPAPLKLAAGNYWIGLITGATQYIAAEYYDSVPIVEDYNTNSYTAGPSNPFGSFKTTNEQMSLYLTYTAG